MDSFVVDDKIGIVAEPSKYTNEVNALRQLKDGMILLYNNVRPTELELIRIYAGKEVTFFGRDPNISEYLFRLLPCFFHWFGNSICNYARLAGYIVAREQNHITETDLSLEPNRSKIKASCDGYVSGLPELKEVLKWRNKVSAHFALTYPVRDDNIATMEASIIYPVSFHIDRFKTGVLTFSKVEGNDSLDAEIPNWSLTQIFENFSARYWTDVTFNDTK